jgi:hypothetical protein
MTLSDGTTLTYNMDGDGRVRNDYICGGTIIYVRDPTKPWVEMEQAGSIFMNLDEFDVRRFLADAAEQLERLAKGLPPAEKWTALEWAYLLRNASIRAKTNLYDVPKGLLIPRGIDYVGKL